MFYLKGYIMAKIQLKNNVSHIERARIIKRTLGIKVAALYLKKREWSVESALFILCGV
jgi:hypothetical protein